MSVLGIGFAIMLDKQTNNINFNVEKVQPSTAMLVFSNAQPEKKGSFYCGVTQIFPCSLLYSRVPYWKWEWGY